MKKTVSELWEEIFIDLDIITNINNCGYFKITADDIRKYKEPRLMTKFDFSKQLPKVFKENQLGILPIKNGEYIIGKYNLFQNISNTNYEEIIPTKKQLPFYIETIDPDNIYSESNALNVAFLSGMISDTIGEEVVETIQGKMRTTGFSFNIEGNLGTQNIVVEKPAMEIDGGYEGKENVALIEAKNYIPEDFIIRQLYYPYRHWKNKVDKNIIPIFFGYENGVYNFFIYEFKDLNNYNSLALKEIKRFIISNETSKKIKLRIFNNIELQEEKMQSEIPFPQADSFNKIIGLLDFFEGNVSAEEIAEFYLFDIRQASYYLSAAKYLGLFDGHYGKHKLTLEGLSITSMDIKTRNQKLISLILKHKVFYYTYKYYLDNKELPSKEFIKELMKRYTDIPLINKDGKENEVFKRRASTVKGWVQWIIGCQV